MENLSPFCTCKNLQCPLHPTKHDKGCAPCMEKNLRLREMPNCIFDQIEGADARDGDSYEEFAHCVLKQS